MYTCNMTFPVDSSLEKIVSGAKGGGEEEGSQRRGRGRRRGEGGEGSPKNLTYLIT